MTNRNSSNINIPEAREAMDKFKMDIYHICFFKNRLYR